MSFFDDFRKARASLTGRESIATLNYMLEYFGDDGENWTPRVYSAANGARCLVGAADYARVSAVDDAKYWLRQAIAEREPHLRTIEQFNELARVLRRDRRHHSPGDSTGVGRAIAGSPAGRGFACPGARRDPAAGARAFSGAGTGDAGCHAARATAGSRAEAQFVLGTPERVTGRRLGGDGR